MDIELYLIIATMTSCICICLGFYFVIDEKSVLKGGICFLIILCLIFVPFLGSKESTFENVNLVAHLTKDGIPYVEYDGLIVPIGTKIEQNIMDGDKIIATRRHNHHAFLTFEKRDWEYAKDRQ